MNQKLALEILLEGHSAFLTGPAGTGKTFLLNQFIRFAKAAGKHVSVTATTGLAATHLGGNTIHAWSGLGIHDDLPRGFLEKLSKTRRETIEKTDVLLIDEISMLHDFRLDVVNEVCQLVRKSEAPFGGIQVVMSGDFFQLPPVNRDGSREGSFVTNSAAWRELDPVILYLDEQFRQDEQDPLLEILSAMRSGDLRRHHAEKLLARIDEEVPYGELITELHTTNVDVDSINDRELKNVAGTLMEYTSYTTGSENYVETLRRSVLAPETLLLKAGALVMAVKNDVNKKYVNGSIGVVTGFEEVTNYPIVEFRSGKTITVQPDTWELRDGDKKRASISQVPLRLAYAITVHKSQGLTLDAAVINLRRAFVEGMGYVALSRVRSLSNLYLTGINQMALRVSQEAQRIDEQLRNKAALDRRRFAHLEAKARKRNLEKEIAKVKQDKKTGNWSEKIAAMRREHPKAFMPWEKEDDETLKRDFVGGKSIAELSQRLGRHEGSIRARLKKHYGDDILG